MSSIDRAMHDLMSNGVEMNVADPQLDDEDGNQSYSYFTGTCGRVCTALTHFACCIKG